MVTFNNRTLFSYLNNTHGNGKLLLRAMHLLPHFLRLAIISLRYHLANCFHIPYDILIFKVDLITFSQIIKMSAINENVKMSLCRVAE